MRSPCHPLPTATTSNELLTRRHAQSSLQYILSCIPPHSPTPPVVISSSFRSKNPSSSSLDTKPTPPRLPYPYTVILNPYHQSIIYHAALSSPPRRPSRLGFRQKMRPFVWELGRLRLTRSHNDAVALFLPKTNGCY